MTRYLISWGDPLQRFFDISITFDAPADEPRLLLPIWRPGRYILQYYAANVRDVIARDSEGNPRDVRKEDLSVWRVRASKGEQVTVSYRYYAGRLDAGSSFLDADEAYFNGTNLFMLVEGLREAPVTLTIAAPVDWRVETQLPHADGEGHVFRARNYDHLVDSPTVASPSLTRHTFNAAGARIHLVFIGDEGIDTEMYVDPVRSIIEEQARLFGGLPLAEYRFLTHFADKWHGVEHEDSCSIVADRKAMLDAQPVNDGYSHFLSIVSHEFFHVWNVKRVLPERFAPYDYFHPTTTSLLWFFEGGTSYYGGLTLLRSGVWSLDDYLRHLEGQISTLQNAPGREHLPLAQASFDSWLHDAAFMHDRANGWYSFYNKGELVCLLLDLAIRESSGGSRSLDDVVRLLWKQHQEGRSGVAEDGIERAVADIADVGDFFDRYVRGTDELPYAEMLGTLGIEVQIRSRNDHGTSLGAAFTESAGVLSVGSVVAGGAAANAGLMAGDELLALGGMRVRSERDVERVLTNSGAQNAVEAVVTRMGTVRTVSIRPASDPRVETKLVRSGEDERLDRWLGRKA